MKNQVIIWILLALIAGLSVYNTLFLGRIKEITIKPTSVQVIKPSPRITETANYDYSNNMVIGNKLRITPVANVSHAQLSRNIGDVWFDATNEALRFWDGSSSVGAEFVIKPYGGEVVQDGIPNIYLETINVTSANLLAGDSLLIVDGIADTKIIPLLIHVFYDDGTTYTHAGTDSTLIYTYSNTVKTKIAYITDTLIEGTFDRHASVAIDEVSSSSEQPYWIQLKNFNSGNGTLTLDFYYVKKED